MDLLKYLTTFNDRRFYSGIEHILFGRGNAFA